VAKGKKSGFNGHPAITGQAILNLNHLCTCFEINVILCFIDFLLMFQKLKNSGK
jgi:hypothetical protein